MLFRVHLVEKHSQYPSTHRSGMHRRKQLGMQAFGPQLRLPNTSPQLPSPTGGSPRIKIVEVSSAKTSKLRNLTKALVWEGVWSLHHPEKTGYVGVFFVHARWNSGQAPLLVQTRDVVCVQAIIGLWYCVTVRGLSSSWPSARRTYLHTPMLASDEEHRRTDGGKVRDVRGWECIHSD